jgi:hypothetical protein
MGYIILLLKETQNGWNLSSKYILYFATAETAILIGLFIGFSTTLVYITFSVVIVVVCLPFLRTFLDKMRKRKR